jgi:hypothetical protein
MCLKLEFPPQLGPTFQCNQWAILAEYLWAKGIPVEDGVKMAKQMANFIGQMVNNA